MQIEFKSSLISVIQYELLHPISVQNDYGVWQIGILIGCDNDFDIALLRVTVFNDFSNWMNDVKHTRTHSNSNALSWCSNNYDENLIYHFVGFNSNVAISCYWSEVCAKEYQSERLCVQIIHMHRITDLVDSYWDSLASLKILR